MVTYPGDWEEVSIDSLFDIYAGGDVKTEFYSAVRTAKYPFPIYSNGLENQGLYGYTSMPVYPGNSVTVTARGTIGYAFYRENPFDAVIRLLVLVPKNSAVCPKFYEYVINSQLVFEQENTGVPQLTVPKIGAKLAPYPSLREQVAIAETIAAFDTHISNLAALIEKKRAIRDGALEDLMSGRTRLDGFSGEWKRTTLGKEYHVIMGQSPPSSSYNSSKNGLPLVQGNADIKNGITVPERYTSMPVRICEAGAVLLSVRAPIGTVSRANQTVCLGRGVCALNGSNNDFIYQMMKYYESAWATIGQGSTFTAITGKDVRNFKIRIPDDKEQDAIAEALTAMDDEINSLEAERDKMTQIREGVMDDLLTGRKRLN